MNTSWFQGIILTSALATGLGQSAPAYFLVAEPAGQRVHDDSFVIAVTSPEQSEHARKLVSDGSAAGETIVFCKIAAGADGVNRDLLATGTPQWSWRVTEVQGFGDFGIELLDGWPTFVEQDVSGWVSNTDGRIGFWTYTVVAELPFTPRVQLKLTDSSAVRLNLDRLTPSFPATLEASADPATGWQLVRQWVPTTQAEMLQLPVLADAQFYRVTSAPAR